MSSSFHSSPLRSESLHLLSYFFLSVSWAESFCKIHNQKSINPAVVTWMENRNYNFQTVPVITSLVNHLQSYANPMPSSLHSSHALTKERSRRQEVQRMGTRRTSPSMNTVRWEGPVSSMVVPTGLSHPPSSGSTEGLRPVRLKEERKEAPGTKSLSEMRMEWNDKNIKSISFQK